MIGITPVFETHTAGMFLLCCHKVTWQLEQELLSFLTEVMWITQPKHSTLNTAYCILRIGPLPDSTLVCSPQLTSLRQPAIYACPVMLLEKKLVQLYFQWLWIEGVPVLAAFSPLTEAAQVLATLSFILYLCFASGINHPQQAFAACCTTKHQALSVSTAHSFAAVQ